jgi:hypothetical protein
VSVSRSFLFVIIVVKESLVFPPPVLTEGATLEVEGETEAVLPRQLLLHAPSASASASSVVARQQRPPVVACDDKGEAEAEVAAGDSKDPPQQKEQQDRDQHEEEGVGAQPDKKPEGNEVPRGVPLEVRGMHSIPVLAAGGEQEDTLAAAVAAAAASLSALEARFPKQHSWCCAGSTAAVAGAAMVVLVPAQPQHAGTGRRIALEAQKVQVAEQQQSKPAAAGQLHQLEAVAAGCCCSGTGTAAGGQGQVQVQPEGSHAGESAHCRSQHCYHRYPCCHDHCSRCWRSCCCLRRCLHFEC